MRRFETFNWCGVRAVNEALAKLGYEHRKVFDGDVFDAARRFHEAGINVMILKTNDPEKTILALDTMSFSQR